MEWRDRVLGITVELDPRCHIDIRKAWLWVFEIHIVYGLRIAEVFVIKNLEKILNYGVDMITLLVWR